MAKILVIEDSDLLREELLEWLMLEGYEAIGADNGRTGIEAASRQRPDLILCDMMMPELDGYGLLQEVRTNFRLASIPCILLSANRMEDDIRKGITGGADAYITKPCTRYELFSKIEAWLPQKA